MIFGVYLVSRKVKSDGHFGAFYFWLGKSAILREREREFDVLDSMIIIIIMMISGFLWPSIVEMFYFPVFFLL
jgi:hypothetical protein